MYDPYPYGVYSLVGQESNSSEESKTIAVTSTRRVRSIVAKCNFVRGVVGGFWKHVILDPLPRGKGGEGAHEVCGEGRTGLPRTAVRPGVSGTANMQQEVRLGGQVGPPAQAFSRATL